MASGSPMSLRKQIRQISQHLSLFDNESKEVSGHQTTGQTGASGGTTTMSREHEKTFFGQKNTGYDPFSLLILLVGIVPYVAAVGLVISMAVGINNEQVFYEERDVEWYSSPTIAPAAFVTTTVKITYRFTSEEWCTDTALGTWRDAGCTKVSYSSSDSETNGGSLDSLFTAYLTSAIVIIVIGGGYLLWSLLIVVLNSSICIGSTMLPKNKRRFDIFVRVFGLVVRAASKVSMLIAMTLALAFFIVIFHSSFMSLRCENTKDDSDVMCQSKTLSGTWSGRESRTITHNGNEYKWVVTDAFWRPDIDALSFYINSLITTLLTIILNVLECCGLSVHLVAIGWSLLDRFLPKHDAEDTESDEDGVKDKDSDEESGKGMGAHKYVESSEEEEEISEEAASEDDEGTHKYRIRV